MNNKIKLSIAIFVLIVIGNGCVPNNGGNPVPSPSVVGKVSKAYFLQDVYEGDSVVGQTLGDSVVFTYDNLGRLKSTFQKLVNTKIDFTYFNGYVNASKNATVGGFFVINENTRYNFDADSNITSIKITSNFLSSNQSQYYVLNYLNGRIDKVLYYNIIGQDTFPENYVKDFQFDNNNNILQYNIFEYDSTVNGSLTQTISFTYGANKFDPIFRRDINNNQSQFALTNDLMGIDYIQLVGLKFGLSGNNELLTKQVYNVPYNNYNNYSFSYVRNSSNKIIEKKVMSGVGNNATETTHRYTYY